MGDIMNREYEFVVLPIAGRVVLKRGSKIIESYLDLKNAIYCGYNLKHNSKHYIHAIVEILKGNLKEGIVFFCEYDSSWNVMTHTQKEEMEKENEEYFAAVGPYGYIS